MFIYSEQSKPDANLFDAKNKYIGGSKLQMFRAACLEGHRSSVPCMSFPKARSLPSDLLPLPPPQDLIHRVIIITLVIHLEVGSSFSFSISLVFHFKN